MQASLLNAPYSKEPKFKTTRITAEHLVYLGSLSRNVTMTIFIYRRIGRKMPSLVSSEPSTAFVSSMEKLAHREDGYIALNKLPRTSASTQEAKTTTMGLLRSGHVSARNWHKWLEVLKKFGVFFFFFFF